MRIASAVRARVLEGFDDPALEAWDRLLARGETNEVFLTREWQRAWWETWGRGELLLILVEDEGGPVALAPLFADSGMVFPVGSGGSDYLDLIGDTSDRATLDAILSTAAGRAPGFMGFNLYHVPERSRTGSRLAASAERIGLTLENEGELSAPALGLEDPQAAAEAAGRKSLRRHEAFFRREGGLEVHHHREAFEVLPHLEAFFDQHVERWADTPTPSLFTDPRQRDFYERLTRAGGAAGWLRFTRLEWRGRHIAFHFGFSHAGSFLWYKPSFAVDLARRSPGEVLLRQLILAATREGSTRFDFGLGDEPFKLRFATSVERVRTWGLYPKEAG